MNIKYTVLIGSLLIIMFLTLQPAVKPANDEDGKKPIDWDKIISIDPLREDIGDFLKHDLALIQFRAEEAMRNGDYLTAAKYYLFLVRHKYDSSVTLYNLACCYGKLNQPEFAAKFFMQSLRAGFNNIGHFLKDTDFNSVRGKGEFGWAEETAIELEKAFGDKILLTTSKVMEGRIHLPENYDPAKSYPLLVALHGSGDRAENFAAMWKEIKKKDFIFLAPEAPYEMRDLSLYGIGYSWFYLTPDRKIWEYADPLTAQNVIRAVEQISQQYKVNGVHILGFSQGVAAAFLTAYYKPEIFQSVTVFAGRLPDDQNLKLTNHEAFKRLKIYIAHGKIDNSVAINESVKTKNRLEALGCKTVFYEFEGGHYVNPEILNKILSELFLNE